MGWTAKRKRFVSEYLIDSNGTQAAIRAGFSPKSGAELARKLLVEPEIRAEVDRRLARVAQKAEITAERILHELARVAFADIRNVVEFGPGGVTIRADTELSDDAAAAIAEVSETVTKEGGSQRIKLHDKLAALDKLGKHLNLFQDGAVNLNLNITVEERRARILANLAIAEQRMLGAGSEGDDTTGSVDEPKNE